MSLNAGQVQESLGPFFCRTREVMSEYLNKQEFSDVSFVVEGATLLGVATLSHKSHGMSE